ncbi:hypothetical protein AAC387_Pa01g3104 [Persea americana]
MSRSEEKVYGFGQWQLDKETFVRELLNAQAKLLSTHCFSFHTSLPPSLSLSLSLSLSPSLSLLASLCPPPYLSLFLSLSLAPSPFPTVLREGVVAAEVGVGRKKLGM